MNLRIYNWNNYYNRIVKKLNETSEEFDNYIHEIQSTNFNPNDDINTEHIFGSLNNTYSGEGDYLLVINELNQIVSRWFIIEKTRLRGGQWKLILRRDLVVDFYDEIVDAPCFIEKATLNTDDPLLFNSEDMSFNQIKKLEFPLKDETLSAWVVGYYAKNTSAENLTGTIAVNAPDSMYDIQIPVPFESWEFNATTKKIVTSINALDYCIKHQSYAAGSIKVSYLQTFTSSGYHLGEQKLKDEKPSILFTDSLKAHNGIEKGIKAQASTLFEQAKTYITTPILSGSQRNEFLKLNNKIIRDSTGAFYQINIFQDSLKYERVSITSGSLFNSLSNIIASTGATSGSPNSQSFQIYVSFIQYGMTARRLTYLETSWNIASTSEWSPLITEDAPYNIFAIPFDSCKLKTGISSEDIYRSDPTYTLPLVESMIRKMGSNLYDIQLLPYCPVNYIGENLVDVKASSAYTLIKDASDNVVSFILHVPQTKISRNIQLDYFAIPKPESAIETKISNECDKYRLCSPNFNGYFDFSPAKNGGVNFFNVDCTLKPYQPYIHLNPNFGGLYGLDFDDPRGLICGGDFSLSQFEDKWQEYQIQNKNYQEMFDRQIQNMEVQNKYQREKEIWSAVAGTVSGSVSGAATGGFASGGNPYAAAAGAVVGGGVSAWGGIKDLQINQALRNEAIDYTKDQFGYQLGNIQALPYTLTKVSAFNNNNKIFPILERYTCTDREKEAFVNKLAYNGMTVMTIGSISEYANNSWSYTNPETGNEITSKGYIKGKIIRLSDLSDDYHLAKEISNEINLGVFI